MKTDRRPPWRWALVAGAALLAIPFALVQGTEPEDPFPHEDHEGLFPFCTGCHLGISVEGEPIYPEPRSCDTCHDGEEYDPVVWAPPVKGPTNLSYDHLVHNDLVVADQGEEEDCASCHSPSLVERWTVEEPQAEGCITCHAHQADDHLTGGECTTCHLPLAETGYSLSQIEGLEIPGDHDLEGFLAVHHGEAAPEDINRCATCHTQDRCASCHVNAGSVESILALAPAPPGMALPVMVAHYPTPETHEAKNYLFTHGMVEGHPVSGEDCSTCHTQNDCTACHVEPYPPSVTFMDTLVPRGQVVAPGVGVESQAPANHENPYFMNQHLAFAAADEANCTTCHTESYCQECHNAPRSPMAYHPDNFMQVHASQAYSQAMECSTCHSTEVFCRECHYESGLRGQGRLGPGYHDAEPAWLLRHGLPARQNLESCASCHQQQECLQCHSQLGAFKISPHGPDFDPVRMQQKNPSVCWACHLTNPVYPGGRPQ